jgi:hypothetical protein
VKKLITILDYIAPYDSCRVNDWLWWALAGLGIAIVVGGTFLCATTPEMCGELL